MPNSISLWQPELEEKPQFNRKPPGFRRPDCCAKCRAYFSICKFYDIGTAHPDEWVCDDFKEE